MPSLSRRQCLRLFGLSPFALPLLERTSFAQAPTPLQPLNRFPRMVHEHFELSIFHRGFPTASTRGAALDYVDNVRKRIAQCFGPFPEKSPLNPRVTGVVDRESHL